MNVLVFFFCFCVAYSTSIHRIGAQEWFNLGLYGKPEIGGLPRLYPERLVDASINSNPNEATIYTFIDPVNTGSTNPSTACAHIPPNPITSDARGHCYPACTQYLVPNQNVVGLDVTQIFCLSLAHQYTTTLSLLLQSAPVEPEYTYMNCTNNLLLRNPFWYTYAPVYDYWYSQSQSGTGASSVYPPGLINTPSCFYEETWFHSQGLPRSPFDSPNIPISEVQYLFYCQQTSTRQADLTVAYTYNCSTVSTINSVPNAKYFCYREIVVVGTKLPGSGKVVLEWSSTDFVCDIPCVGPFYTAHAYAQQYDPQPTAFGCSPSDASSLCHAKYGDENALLCQNGETLQSLVHYRQSDLVALGFDTRGKFDPLGPGAPNPDIDLNYLFEARLWDKCTPGTFGCTPYCHNWTPGKFGGTPKHPQCNGHGTLRESRHVGLYMRCNCEPGYFGNKCQFQRGNQWCGNGMYTSPESDSFYYNF